MVEPFDPLKDVLLKHVTGDGLHVFDLKGRKLGKLTRNEDHTWQAKGKSYETFKELGNV